MSTNKFYITTTLPYVNAEPHVGHALELIQADVLARYHALQGREVIFNTGTDEHGLKVYRKALEENKDPKDYVDENFTKFSQLKVALNLSYTNFIRTTDPDHIEAAQEFWRLCRQNGDIYKKSYAIKYCVGCELEKTDSELQDGRCPIHPNLDIEEISEENYFFRFSNYQDKLLKFYEDHTHFVLPNPRFNEIKRFVEGGIKDFSISRLKAKMPWGIQVPDDPDHVMYVWFDALVNYISTLGWPDEKEKFNNFWPPVQIAGKDNLRQQSAIWQAMLMSVGLPPSRQILIHGYITIDGQKISKSMGNGNNFDPFKLTHKFGAEAVRYYLLREIPTTEDGDFSISKLVDRYNSDLANNLGNLVSRIMKLVQTRLDNELIYKQDFLDKDVKTKIREVQEETEKSINEFKLHEALAKIWELLTYANAYVNEHKPWTENDDPKHFLTTMTSMVRVIIEAARMIEPFLPYAAQKIYHLFEYNPSTASLEGYRFRVIEADPLFPRIETNETN